MKSIEEIVTDIAYLVYKCNNRSDKKSITVISKLRQTYVHHEQESDCFHGRKYYFTRYVNTLYLTLN